MPKGAIANNTFPSGHVVGVNQLMGTCLRMIFINTCLAGELKATRIHGVDFKDLFIPFFEIAKEQALNAPRISHDRMGNWHR